MFFHFKFERKIKRIRFKNIKEIGSPTDFRHHFHAGMDKAPNAEMNVPSMNDLKQQQIAYYPIVPTSITPPTLTPTPTPASTPPITPTDHISILARDTQTMDQIQNLDKLL